MCQELLNWQILSFLARGWIGSEEGDQAWCALTGFNQITNSDRHVKFKKLIGIMIPIICPFSFSFFFHLTRCKSLSSFHPISAYLATYQSFTPCIETITQQQEHSDRHQTTQDVRHTGSRSQLATTIGIRTKRHERQKRTRDSTTMDLQYDEGFASSSSVEDAQTKDIIRRRRAQSLHRKKPSLLATSQLSSDLLQITPFDTLGMAPMERVLWLISFLWTMYQTMALPGSSLSSGVLLSKTHTHTVWAKSNEAHPPFLFVFMFT